MSSGLRSSRRRMLLGGWTALAVAAIPPGARALTGVAALDTRSIRVKTPAGVILIGITLAYGGRLVAVGEHGVIIYSDDNGASWTQASVPVNLTLTCVSFATAKIGWAAGHFGVILNTQDGGKTWQEQLNGIQVNQMIVTAASDPSVATDPSPGAPVAAVRAQHFAADGPDKPFLTMLVFSPMRVIVFGAYRLAMLSNDGGKTWVDWDLHIYDKYSHNIYGAAAVGDVYYIVCEEGLMFSSSDGGNTFLPVTSPSASTLLGVLGAKDGSLIVFGVAGFAARSTDKGNSWTVLAMGMGDNLTGGSLLDTGDIVLVNEAGVLFESGDNGATFGRVQGIRPVPFFDVQQASNGDLIAVGAEGVSQISKSLLA